MGGGHPGFVSEAGSLGEGDHVPVLGGHVEPDAVPGPAVMPALVALCDGFRAGFLGHAELRVRARPPARPLSRLSSASWSGHRIGGLAGRRAGRAMPGSCWLPGCWRGEREVAAAPARVGADEMISEADVQKLQAIHASGPSVLSLYMWVPVDVSALPGLPARADELLEVAAEGMGGQQALKARSAERQAALALWRLTPASGWATRRERARLRPGFRRRRGRFWRRCGRRHRAGRRRRRRRRSGRHGRRLHWLWSRWPRRARVRSLRAAVYVTGVPACVFASVLLASGDDSRSRD